jgi:hypothetical protein
MIKEGHLRNIYHINSRAMILNIKDAEPKKREQYVRKSMRDVK